MGGIGYYLWKRHRSDANHRFAPKNKHTKTGKGYLRGFLEQITSYMDGD